MSLDDLELHALNLVVEEAIECHGGGRRRIREKRCKMDDLAQGDGSLDWVDGGVPEVDV